MKKLTDVWFRVGAMMLVLTGCGGGGAVGPLTPGFPPDVQSEVARAQTEVLRRTYGVCSAPEQALLIEGVALHFAAVTLDFRAEDRVRLEQRNRELRSARARLSPPCRRAIGVRRLGPFPDVTVDGGGLASPPRAGWLARVRDIDWFE